LLSALHQSPLLLAVMAASVPVMAASGWRLLTMPRPGESRLGQAAVSTEEETGPGVLTRLVDAFGRRLAPPTMRMLGERQIAKTRKKLEAAGRYGSGAVEVFMGRRTVFTLAGVIYGLLMIAQGQAIVGVMSMALGVLAADVLLARTVRLRQEAIERSLPDFLDILSVTVSAGLGFRQALTRLAETLSGPLTEEIQTTLRQMEIGMTRRDALESLRDRNESPTLASFVTALLQGEELGAPLASTLNDLSATMRETWAQEAKRRAAKAEPKISLVLTFVIGPASILLFAAGLLLELFGGDNGFNTLFGG
jgi:tight adherence protein C